MRLPGEIIEHIFRFLNWNALQCCRVVSRACYQHSTRAARQLSQLYLDNPVYQRHALQHSDSLGCWQLLHTFRCHGCGHFPHKFFFLHPVMGGVGCLPCAQHGGPLQLVSAKDAREVYGLAQTDIRFLSGSNRLLRLRQEPLCVRLQDAQALSFRKCCSQKKYVDTVVAHRRAVVLQRAAQLDLPDSTVNIFRKRQSFFYGPAYHFRGRNVDHILLSCCRRSHRDLVEMHIAAASGDATTLQLVYHSLLQKLEFELNNVSWVGEDILVPNLLESLAHADKLMQRM